MPHAPLLLALPDAAVLLDPDGAVRQWNPAAEQLFGLPPFREDLPIEELPLAFLADTRGQVAQVLSGRDWDDDYDFMRDDGRHLHLHGHASAVRRDDGSLTGVLTVTREIPAGVTDAAHRDDPYAAEILDSMSAHVAVLDPQGRVREVNRAWHRFAHDNGAAHASPSDIGVGADYVHICRTASGPNADGADLAADGIEAVLRGERAMFTLEYPCDAPDEARWFAMHVTPLKSQGGGAVVAHYDITARKHAELAAAIQSRRTELALTAAHMGVWTVDLRTAQVHWTAEVYRVVGVDTFDGTVAGWNALMHPEDRPELTARFDAAVRHRMPFTAEYRIVRPTGETRWLTTVAQVECDTEGQPIAVVGTVQDITARKRSTWALTAYNNILELIALGSGLREVLEAVVRLVEEQLPGSLCSVLIVDPATRSLRLGAAPSLPDAYNRAIDGVPIAPSAGSCGTAAYRGSTVTVTDIRTDPLWDDYRAFALPHGLHSCVSVPILSSGNVPGRERGEVIGTFALYNRTAGAFDRLTYAILSGAEELVRRAMQATSDSADDPTSDQSSVVEAAHLAGVAIERDYAGQAIRDSDERFRSVFDSTPSAIFVKDLAGRFVFTNQAACDLFGIAPSAWSGKTARELLPRALAEVCEASDEQLRSTGQSVEERHTCPFPSGRVATILATHMFLHHADGTPYAICGILRDITDLVAAQQEFERLWLHAPEPLCVAGFDGSYRRVNPAWTRIMGWSEQELLSTPWSTLVHPDDLARTQDAFAALRAGRSVHRLVQRTRCKDGRYRWFSWEVIPLPGEHQAYGFARDITEERQLAEQFQQAQKMEAVGQLASGVAHDFNNLLTIILSYTEMLLSESSADALHREYLSQVLGAGARASELTSQLLAFSRKAIVEPRVLDINHVVDASARMLRRLIGEQVRLETRLEVVPPVRIDAGQLEQVLMNLALNARDAMPRGGDLLIRSAPYAAAEEIVTASGSLPPGAYVALSVQDTGIGMTPDTVARIFEPFFTTKSPGKGTGLGLATVYGTLQQAGGGIVVRSEPGIGTTFELLLPVATAPVTQATPAADTAVARGLETILVVEDEPGVRRVVSTMLERQGYTVLLAESATEALRLATQEPGAIDLLLTDVVMPDIGGRALAEALRAQRPTIRVLYMSGYTDDAMLRAGVEQATDRMLQKPFSPAALMRSVREVLDAAE